MLFFCYSNFQKINTEAVVKRSKDKNRSTLVVVYWVAHRHLSYAWKGRETGTGQTCRSASFNIFSNFERLCSFLCGVVPVVGSADVRWSQR
jgi:hypothetical protein